MAVLSPGDMVLIPAVDRLARDMTDLLVLARDMQRAGAGERSLAEATLDTTSECAEIVPAVIGLAACLKRKSICARTVEGRADAKAKGVKFGRKPKLTPHQRREAAARLQEGATQRASPGATMYTNPRLRGYRAMAENSAIEWTDTTWNPVTGCTKISAGCENCYASRFSERFRGVLGHPFESGFDLTLRPERLLQPLGWKRPRMVFVNSMSDLFHKEIPKAHIAAVFDTMEKAHWHTYQVLTKRSSLLQKFINDRYREKPAPRHIWLGVSVEDEKAATRIAHLQAANADVRFLSIEPLIAPVGRLNLSGIEWVIVGGESGPRSRPMNAKWVIDIRNQCVKAGVAFFFKQWGGFSPKAGGRLLEGKEWSQFPGRRRTASKQPEMQAGA